MARAEFIRWIEDVETELVLVISAGPFSCDQDSALKEAVVWLQIALMFCEEERPELFR